MKRSMIDTKKGVGERKRGGEGASHQMFAPPPGTRYPCYATDDA